MTMTSSETQWVARVMHTISYVAFIESCNTVAGTLQKGAGEAGEEVIRAARSFIEKLKREDADNLTTRSLDASSDMSKRNATA
jgi:hypothetical protein